MKALLIIDMLEDFIDKEGKLTTGPAGEKNCGIYPRENR